MTLKSITGIIFGLKTISQTKPKSFVLVDYNQRSSMPPFFHKLQFDYLTLNFDNPIYQNPRQLEHLNTIHFSSILIQSVGCVLVT